MIRERLARFARSPINPRCACAQRGLLASERSERASLLSCLIFINTTNELRLGVQKRGKNTEL